MTYSQHPIDLGFSDERVSCGSHICYVYSDDDERLELLAQYLRAGRQAGDQLRFITDSLSPQTLRKRMERIGFAPETVEIETASDAYYPNGHFDAEQMLADLADDYVEAREADHPGLRTTGELSWLDRDIPGSEHILEYEAKLTKRLDEYPLTGLCQYDARRFSGRFLTDVLRLHPYVLVAGQLIQNPYFIDPDAFLAGRHHPRYDYERRL